MTIQRDDPARPDVRALLEEHLREMHALSPRESVHALDVSGLKTPEITFWTVREHGVLVGCGALKALGNEHGEIKSMRTPASARRRGAGRAMLAHLIAEARQRGYTRLSLETGSMEAFRPAQQLYASAGFTPCGPFDGYAPDPNSVFMTLELPPILTPITGFHQDDEEQWVAKLACGHGQHVRHDPPWQLRPWVTTPEGRSDKLGVRLRCRKCERGEAVG